MEGYQIVDKKDRRKLAEFLAGEGEVLLPLLEMIETAEANVNAAVDVIGRAGIEALLMLSAQQIAGAKQPGNSGDIILISHVVFCVDPADRGEFPSVARQPIEQRPRPAQ